MSLLSLKNLSNKDIVDYIELACSFRDGKQVDFKNKKVVVNLFFEASTRTHYSFSMAAMRLGCQVMDFNPSSSSLLKDETFNDTYQFFQTMQPDAIVIRSSQEEYYKHIDTKKVPIINGGDGIKDHPTQSLLDLMTIYESFGRLNNLSVLIVGDIKHSRVAHSNIEVLERLNNKVYLTGPKPFIDEGLFFVDFDEYIDQVDVVMLLRIQKERHIDQFENNDYLEKYGLSMRRYHKLKEDAIILHPAPFNRGIEIADEVVNAPKSRIFKQMENGLYVRMAVLYNELK